MKGTVHEQHQTDEAITFDVVCGQLVNAATTRHKSVYRGTTYYFCCAGCQRKFESNPGAFEGQRAHGPFH